MPYYADLRLREGESEFERARKKKTAGDLLALRAALRQELGKTRHGGEDGGEGGGEDGGEHGASGAVATLRIATWNLREFDSSSYGHRLPEALYYIAEIISHFDIVAIQEVRRDLFAFRRLARILGSDWKFVMTDAAEGSRQNRERMAFLYDSKRVDFQGIAGELTLSEGDRLFLPNSFDLLPGQGVEVELPAGTTLVPPATVRTSSAGGGRRKIDPEAVVDLPAGTKITVADNSQLVFRGQPAELRDDRTLDLGAGPVRQFSQEVGVRWPTEAMRAEDLQFARTPFIVYFQAGWMKLALCTVHIYYGDETEGSLKMVRRQAEIAAISRALANKASEENDSDADSYFVALGDFNIVKPEHGTMAALESNDFRVPDALKQIPKGSNVRRDKFYDQIAIWMGKTKRRQRFRDYTRIEVRRAGIFDYFKHVFREGDDDAGGADEAYYRARMTEVGEEYKSYRTWRTYQMSDHLPMWVEIDMDFSEAYLRSIAGVEQTDD